MRRGCMRKHVAAVIPTFRAVICFHPLRPPVLRQLLLLRSDERPHTLLLCLLALGEDLNMAVHNTV
jgi:hypothetical protein